MNSRKKSPTILPPNFVDKMSPVDRASLGQKTTEERSAAIDLRLERDLHKLIMQELSRRQIFYVHSRTDRKSTNQVGLPDFIFLNLGLPTAVEVKLPGRTLTEEQEYVRSHMVQSGWRYFKVESFESFILVVNSNA